MHGAATMSELTDQSPTGLGQGVSAAARHHKFLNDLLNSSDVRNGTLEAAMQALIRTFAQEAVIDRVAVAVYDGDKQELVYSQVYISLADLFTQPFFGVAPMTLFKLAVPGRTLVSSDLATHPLLAPLYENQFSVLDTRGFLQLPIDVNGKLLGVINASVCGRECAWTEGQVLLGQAIANLASLVIERHTRHRIEQQQAETTARLKRQQVALSRLMKDNTRPDRSLAEELQSLADATTAALAVERVSFLQLAPTRDSMTTLEQYDTRTKSHKSGQSIAASDHPVYFEALLADGVMAVDDIKSDRRTSSFLESYVRATGVASFLDMVIVSGNAPVGVVSVEKCAAIVWTDEHKLFLAAITGLAALAMERSERLKAQSEISVTAKRLTNHFTVVNSLMESDAFLRGTMQDALRHLSRTLCREMGADCVKLRAGHTGRADAPPYSEVYSVRRDAHVSGGPNELTQPVTSTDIAAFSRLELIADVRTEMNVLPHQLVLIQKYDVRSVLQVPIRMQGDVIGYVRAWTTRRNADWKSGETLLVAGIAQLAALVLERLHRHLIETSLRLANTAAEQASRAKSQFLANMSHEIRTPMNGVFGMTDLLLQTQLTQRQSQIVGTIQQSTNALLTIINDILDLSRIESGRIELETKPFQMRACIESAVALFAEEARRKGILLAVAVDRSCPAWHLGDAARVRQICVNLLGNALKFTSTGSITMSVHAEAESSTLHFAVRDTGIGIDPSVQDILFQPFAQADGSITRRFGGTGLGLSISKSLVDMMGGKITLDSVPNFGTTVAFSINLPAVQAPVVAESSRASLSAWLAGPSTTPPSARSQRRFGGCVLVAEDNPVNQEVARELVSALGCTVVCVENGEEAVRALETQAFDLVLMDCQMPIMDGITATRQIRASETATGKPRIAIVAVTANAFAEDRDACLACGMDGYLSKPFTGAQVDDMLQRWLPAHLVIERRGAGAARSTAHDDDIPVLDPIVLEPMKRMRMSFYVRLLTTFMTHTPKLIEAIEKAAHDQDRPALRLAAHSLKSSSANVGASRLSALARTAEMCATRGEMADSRAMAAAIAAAYATVADLFNAELAAAQGDVTQSAQSA
jgi:signal transduction histidine kinase/CheY-like chemotaxis protein